ncbi:MAG: hypothetical protein Q8O57_09460 [Kiritimatiellota bacterium]|nr:hypothetical protein [Kiritimatiellota bacterium]
MKEKNGRVNGQFMRAFGRQFTPLILSGNQLLLDKDSQNGIDTPEGIEFHQA